MKNGFAIRLTRSGAEKSEESVLLSLAKERVFVFLRRPARSSLTRIEKSYEKSAGKVGKTWWLTLPKFLNRRFSRFSSLSWRISLKVKAFVPPETLILHCVPYSINDFQKK